MPVKCTMLRGSAPCEKSACPASPGMRGSRATHPVSQSSMSVWPLHSYPCTSRRSVPHAPGGLRLTQDVAPLVSGRDEPRLGGLARAAVQRRVEGPR